MNITMRLEDQSRHVPSRFPACANCDEWDKGCWMVEDEVACEDFVPHLLAYFLSFEWFFDEDDYIAWRDYVDVKDY